jgi:hypothetical protein
MKPMTVFWLDFVWLARADWSVQLIMMPKWDVNVALQLIQKSVA